MCCKVGLAPVAPKDLFAAQVLFIDNAHLSFGSLFGGGCRVGLGLGSGLGLGLGVVFCAFELGEM